MIIKSGRFEPIEVLDYGDGLYYIEDGNTRYAAAKLLGRTILPIEVL
jgi:ParB-like chromosome segregation protein Spo0J